jgi:hypothetical protein
LIGLAFTEIEKAIAVTRAMIELDFRSIVDGKIKTASDFCRSV